jgi:hypothetical protein
MTKSIQARQEVELHLMRACPISARPPKLENGNMAAGLARFYWVHRLLSEMPIFSISLIMKKGRKKREGDTQNYKQTVTTDRRRNRIHYLQTATM